MSFSPQINDDHFIDKPLLIPPGADGNKYDRGHALIYSGPALRTGASRLSARAALAIGAGLVTIIGEKTALNEHAAHVTAIMLKERPEKLEQIDKRVTALAIGPAFGNGKQCRADVQALLETQLPLVADADAITAFENCPKRLFSNLSANAILTPHGGEFKRLFPGLQSGNPVSAALKAAEISGANILLKGAETVIAAPDGRYAINNHGNSWLATAGSGDILTGMICGIIAQGASPFDAACAAAWIHGDIGIRHGAGLTADIMVELIPLVLQACLAK